MMMVPGTFQATTPSAEVTVKSASAISAALAAASRVARDAIPSTHH
jgi:hypothetical protein